MPKPLANHTSSQTRRENKALFARSQPKSKGSLYSQRHRREERGEREGLELVTWNGGEPESLFNHSNLSGSVVGEQGEGVVFVFLVIVVRIVEAVVHVVTPYLLPNPRRLVVQLRYPFLKLFHLLCRRRRRSGGGGGH